MSEFDIIDEGTAKAAREIAEKWAMQGQARTWPEHDCYAWNVQHWHNRSDSNYTTCGTCGRITGFRWKSLKRRVLSLLRGTAVTPR